MSKLTLSVNPEIVRRAKRYAERRGTSVSRIVEEYLAAVTEAPAEEDLPPILRQLRGSLKNVSIEDYHKYLSEKYR
jgi:hypothetical protein